MSVILAFRKQDNLFYIASSGASGVSKQVKVLAKSDDLSSIPRTHTVEAKN